MNIIVVDMNGDAYWSDIPCSSSTKHNINKNRLVAHVECLIDNNMLVLIMVFIGSV